MTARIVEQRHTWLCDDVGNYPIKINKCFMQGNQAGAEGVDAEAADIQSRPQLRFFVYSHGYVLHHADQGVTKTYRTGHAFRETRSCLFEFLQRYTLFA